MGVDRNNGPMGGRHPPRFKFTPDEILDIEFRRWDTFASSACNLSEGNVHNLSQVARGVKMRLKLFGRPDCFEDLDQIRGRNNLDTKAANKFDSSSVNA